MPKAHRLYHIEFRTHSHSPWYGYETVTARFDAALAACTRLMQDHAPYCVRARSAQNNRIGCMLPWPSTSRKYPQSKMVPADPTKAFPSHPTIQPPERLPVAVLIRQATRRAWHKDRRTE